MKKQLARTGLLALIAVELLGGVLALRWALQTGDQRQPITVGIDPGLPEALAAAIQAWAATQPGDLLWVDSPDADLAVTWQKRAGATSLAEVVLVPVAPFFSLRDGITADELRRAWRGRPRSQDTVPHLLVAADTADTLDSVFGLHAEDADLTVVPAADLADRLWSQPEALALVPFDRLEPRLKPLLVDGLSPLDRDLDLGRYPLLAPIWVRGPAAWEQALAAEVAAAGLESNRQLDRLAVLHLTGVTALTRGVALEIEARGDPGWPARGVADLVSAADLTHVSHEVSFVPGCRAQAETRAFCARPEYLEALHLLGTDVVELTGNHNLDFGPKYARQSLDRYAEEGMGTFGGGRDAAEARQPLLLKHRGNRLAFLGYNAYGPEYAWATEDEPGAAPFSLEALQADLAGVRDQADLIFVGIQYTETYDTAPLPAQVADFRAAVELGADVVTGSQAHQPQAVEFHGEGLILYGLGNLIFDQSWSEPTRQSLVVRHYAYDGRLIATELIPTVMGDDFQPHPALEPQREAILQEVFAASGW